MSLVFAAWYVVSPPFVFRRENTFRGYDELMCSTNVVYFPLGLVAYNGILMLVACYYAYSTRNVLPQFNESKVS